MHVPEKLKETVAQISQLTTEQSQYPSIIPSITTLAPFTVLRKCVLHPRNKIAIPSLSPVSEVRVRL